MPLSDLENGKGTVITSSLQDVLREYFSSARRLHAEVEGRLVVL
jgi:hypothetical protein